MLSTIYKTHTETQHEKDSWTAGLETVTQEREEKPFTCAFN